MFSQIKVELKSMLEGFKMEIAQEDKKMLLSERIAVNKLLEQEQLEEDLLHLKMNKIHL